MVRSRFLSRQEPRCLYIPNLGIPDSASPDHSIHLVVITRDTNLDPHAASITRAQVTFPEREMGTSQANPRGLWSLHSPLCCCAPGGVGQRVPRGKSEMFWQPDRNPKPPPSPPPPMLASPLCLSLSKWYLLLSLPYHPFATSNLRCWSP